MRSLEQWYVASPEQHGSGVHSFLRGLVHGDQHCEDGSSRETEVSPDTVAEAGSIITTVRGSQYLARCANLVRGLDRQAVSKHSQE